MASTKKPAAKKPAAKKPAAKKPAAKKPAAKTAKKPATKKEPAAKKPAAKKVAAKKPAAKAAGKAKATSKMKPPSAAFSSIAAILARNPGIAAGKMFGCHGLTVGGRFFTFEHDGELVVKLPPERVAALTAEGVGAPFDPMGGRPSKGSLSVPPGRGDWQRLAEEALAYVSTLPAK